MSTRTPRLPAKSEFGTVLLALAGLVGLVDLSASTARASYHDVQVAWWLPVLALGSTLATVLLSKDVALAEGVLAFALLALLQFAVAATSRRSQAVEALAKAEPRVLLADGRFCDETLAAERVTRDEVRAAVRGAGLGDLTGVAAVVLETDGSLSVIGKGRAGDGSALPQAHS